MSKEMRSKPDNSWKWMLAITGIITIAVIILSVQAGLNPSGSGEIINSLSGNVSAEAAELLSKAEFAPPALCGFIINPQSETNYFDFVLDTGDDVVVDKEKLTPETKELINYFFLGITLPAREFWVNLNPVELNSIISPMLICTGLGKMLLETDLRLKRDAAMLTDPRLACGKEYWDVLKAELNAKNLSNVQIPANTRLWIIPADAVIEEDKDNKDKVILVGAKLKVCLESEYDTDLSANGNISQSEEERKIQDIASQAMKKVILPIIEFRVNYSKDYAQLRQIYQSLILAEYFKHKYWGKQSIYENYINTCSIGGLESKEGWSKEAMFDSYVQSMTKGEYSCIQQEYDPAQAAMIRRHYFSGGMLFSGLQTGLAQGMTPIGPGVVSSGIGGPGDLIAQATTGAGAGEKVVVKEIELLTPEQAAQRTAANPVRPEAERVADRNSKTYSSSIQNKKVIQNIGKIKKELNHFAIEGKNYSAKKVSLDNIGIYLREIANIQPDLQQSQAWQRLQEKLVVWQDSLSKEEEKVRKSRDYPIPIFIGGESVIIIPPDDVTRAYKHEQRVLRESLRDDTHTLEEMTSTDVSMQREVELLIKNVEKFFVEWSSELGIDIQIEIERQIQRLSRKADNRSINQYLGNLVEKIRYYPQAYLSGSQAKEIKHLLACIKDTVQNEKLQIERASPLVNNRERLEEIRKQSANLFLVKPAIIGKATLDRIESYLQEIANTQPPLAKSQAGQTLQEILTEWRDALANEEVSEEKTIIPEVKKKYMQYTIDACIDDLITTNGQVSIQKEVERLSQVVNEYLSNMSDSFFAGIQEQTRKLSQRINDAEIEQYLIELLNKSRYYPQAYLTHRRANEIKLLLNTITNAAKQWEARHPEAERIIGQQEEASSPIREVGGIDLRKIRYRVVFSEG